MHDINYCSIDVTNLPQKPGIYFLYESEDLLYVGKSKNIKTRIKAHISTNKNITNKVEPSHIDYVFHRVTQIEFYEYPEEDLPWIELFFICKLRPILNYETRQSYDKLDQFIQAKENRIRDFAIEKTHDFWDSVFNNIKKKEVKI